MKTKAAQEFQTVREAITALMLATLAKLEEYRAEAESIEVDFFAGYGFNHQTTILSSRYASYIAELSQLLESWKPLQYDVLVSSTDGTPLCSWFGVTV